MARKTRDTLTRKVGSRAYRDVCWVSAEGRTERDYFSMDAFREAEMSVRFPRDIHPDRRNPVQVLKRLQKEMRAGSFRRADEAWVVVDVDEWDEPEFAALLKWEASDERHHLAVSNPKFELFLVMHFDRANGCTTAAKLDAALKRFMPKYAKRLARTQFTRAEIEKAIANAEAKRSSCKDALPAPGMTDAHKLAKRLLEKRVGR